MAAQQPFQVIFEDRYLIVVDKSARVLTVPTPRGERNTLVQLLERYLEPNGPRRRPPIPRQRDRRTSGRSRPLRARALEVVHRLDRDTSGLLVFSKDHEVTDGLRDQFRDHSALRLYLAIVAGEVGTDAGTFDSHLATNRGLQRYSTGPRPSSERAITHFRVRSRGHGTTVVDVRLETGRRNQIRVHFAEAGHPVLGDPRYGSRRAAHVHWPANRLALHAATLGFIHPVTGESMRLESPMPTVFRAFLARQIRGEER